MLALPPWVWALLGVLALASWVVLHRWRPPLPHAEDANH
jgi:hypothetical protein